MSSSSIRSSNSEINLADLDVKETDQTLASSPRAYDVTDKEDLKNYLDNHENGIQQMKGGIPPHQFYLDETHNCFIFIPNGDRDDACVIDVQSRKKKTAQMFRQVEWEAADPQQLLKAAKVFCLSYDSIKPIQEKREDAGEGKLKAWIFSSKNNQLIGFVNPHTAKDLKSHGVSIDLSNDFWQKTVPDILEGKKKSHSILANNKNSHQSHNKHKKHPDHNSVDSNSVDRGDDDLEPPEINNHGANSRVVEIDDESEDELVNNHRQSANQSTNQSDEEDGN